MPRTKQSNAAPQKKRKSAAVHGSPNDVLNLAETAAYLRLPEQAVMQMILEQGLPARKVGLEWRFFKGAIQDWFSSGTPKPQSSKEAILAMAGKFKGDPDLDAIVEEAMRLRGRSEVDGE
jgi:hypothetical protein